MRKKSTRFLSAALAACMMLSVVPVGAFAAAPAAASAESGVSVQDEEQEIRLTGGETITDEKIAEDGSNGVYTLSGEYSNGITIAATQPVTLNLKDTVTGKISKKPLLNVTGTGTVTVNGNDGAFEVKYYSDECASFLEVDNAAADVTVEGGKYSYPFTSYYGKAFF